jgi:nucleoside-diphosphate-sugar epimerase
MRLPAELIAGEIFNVAYQNHTVSELAEMVKATVEEEMPERRPIRIETSPTNDPRSYHVSSRKIAVRLGYSPKRTIEDAVRDIVRAIRDGRLPRSLEDDRYVNVKTLKKSGLR